MPKNRVSTDAIASGWTDSPSLSRRSRRLLTAGLLFLFVAIAALGLMIAKLRTDALADARHTVSSLGLAIAEQTARSMQAGDLVLQELRRQFADRHLETVDEFKAQLSTADQYNFLKDRSDSLPQIDAFTIIAADGKLVNYSRQWPVPPTDLSDRDYLAYFRDHDTTDAFFSEPVQNRGSGTWTVYLVRRIDSESGKFLGMVLAAVDLDYFRDFFKALTTDAGTTVTLLRSDGVVLTSFPPTATIGSSLPKASQWYRIVRTGPAVFLTEGVLAPGTRIVSAHPLQDYPLVINVSVAEWEALAAWVKTAVSAGIFALIAGVCVMLLLRSLLMQLRRLEVSEAMLATRNTALEVTQSRMRVQADELSASREAMAEQSATLQAALRHMDQGIMLVAADGTVAVCNERARTLLDLPRPLMERRPSLGAVIAFQRSAGEFAGMPDCPCTFGFEEAMAGPRVHERQRPNGLILEVHTVPIEGGGLVRTYSDITERRASERQIRFMARHDGLTGLFNRTAFNDRLQALIVEAGVRGQGLGVFYLDLDGFKQINDTHGHATGDQVLIEVARRIRSVVRESDVVARMGGDEFAIVQQIGAPGGSTTELANRLLDTVMAPFHLGPVRFVAGLSIGIALYPDHAAGATELLQDADTALYRAKSIGKRMCCVFDPQLDRGHQSLQSLERDLARAWTERAFYLEYQPIVDSHTLEVIRFEALVRWNDPARGAVPPSEFIGVAERCGLIVPIGLWVLETACIEAASWPWPVEISINLSPVQFARGDLVDHIERVLEQTQLPPARLNLEVTEGVLLEKSLLVTQAMTRLRLLGVRFSLDDFGTAHAGLTYLRSFSFDVLKVDKTFVQDAAKTREARGVLGAIQAIGVACNLQVVAEGVETEAQLAVVRELGCECVQGYLTGRPAREAKLGLNGLARPAGPRPPRLTLVQPS